MVDEFTLGLSPARVSTIKRVVRELADAGAAVLIVEQSAEVVSDIVDRELQMERGVVREAAAAWPRRPRVTGELERDLAWPLRRSADPRRGDRGDVSRFWP